MTSEPLMNRLRREPGKRGGQLIVRDLRITVDEVWTMMEDGIEDDEILRDFPYLEREDLDAVRLYRRQEDAK